MALVAELVAVGTELLLGDIANTDGQFISRQLAALGIQVYHHTVVGDNPRRLTEALELARSRADLIITTGGLGPTCDDLTRQVLAEAFGKPLLYNEEAARRMEERFRAGHPDGGTMTENNYQQAYLPEGCVPFQNDWGTAPGCAFEADGVRVIMLPGPPKECRPMFLTCVVPYLSALTDGTLVSRSLHLFGLGESQVEQKLRSRMEELTNPTLAPYARGGQVELRITAKAENEQAARALIAPVEAEVRALFGDAVYGADVPSLEAVVLPLMKEKGLTLAAAESCTGGLIAQRFTALSGASAVFRGGVVSYATQVKETVLGVDHDLLEEQGAVAAETAAQMAEKVRTLMGADCGVSVTGVAGPDSDERGNPVGLVYVGLAWDGGVHVRTVHIPGDRDRVRTFAANHAFDLLRRHLTGLPL